MANLINLYAETDADMIGDDSTPTLTLKNISTGAALQVATGAAGPLINVIASGVSTSVLKLNTVGYGFVSTNSCASMSYAMNVEISGKLFYVPVYLGAA